jgi:penicillin-binding protein, 1A family
VQKKLIKKKSSWKRSFWIFFILFILIVAGAGCGFLGATMSSLPDVANVKPAASSQIYDANGDLITTVHSEENRLPVKLSEVPKNLQNAFIATEDNRFYSHHGIDPIGILRAVWVNIIHDGVAEGGSTITQQLARNAFLTQDRTFKRKIMEALLALRIEQHYTKQEILEMYMNQIYFGQGAYGVQTASHVYFDKDVQDLSLAQMAILAGLPQSPNYYSPFNNLKAAKARQAVVLGQMVKYDYLSADQAEEAKNADLHLLDKPKSSNGYGRMSYFVDYVINEVSERYGDNAIYKEGMKIYTTIDMKAQRAAEQAMENLPNYYTDENGLQQPQGALISINPHNGHIVAMVGGRGTDSFNRTTMAVRQPGSAFKPFVYLAALKNGDTPGTVYVDKPSEFNGWKPQNYSRRHSGAMTMRNAVAHSNNVVAVLAADKVGMSNVLDLAEKMGISTLDKHGDDNLAVALGGLTKGVTPMDMAVAYGVLANNGVKVKPVAITKIIDRNGNIVEEGSVEETRVVEPKYAYMMTNMLESVIKFGTGGNAYFGRPVAGKTGTTDEEKDAWFAGYTPDLVTVVWMGDDSGSETLHGTTGGQTPAIIWRLYMQAALADTPASNFTVPEGVGPEAYAGNTNPATDKKKDEKDKKDKKDGDVEEDTSTTSNDESPSKSKSNKGKEPVVAPRSSKNSQ